MLIGVRVELQYRILPKLVDNYGIYQYKIIYAYEQSPDIPKKVFVKLVTAEWHNVKITSTEFYGL